MSLGYGGAARLVLSDGESAIYAYKCTNLNRRGNDSCEDGEVVAPRVLYDQAVADLRERFLLFDGCNYRSLLFTNPLFRGLFHF